MQYMRRSSGLLVTVTGRDYGRCATWPIAGQSRWRAGLAVLIPPCAILNELMAANRLKQSDLVPVFGTKSRVSEVVNGKRDISKEQAKKLASFFHVSADLFI
jgi:Helix-turn-helix